LNPFRVPDDDIDLSIASFPVSSHQGHEPLGRPFMRGGINANTEAMIPSFLNKCPEGHDLRADVSSEATL